MKKIYKLFILIFILFTFIYFEKSILKHPILFNKLFFSKNYDSEKNNEIFEEIYMIISNKNNNNVINLLNSDKDIKVDNLTVKEEVNLNPIIYIYSTHDKEEYSNEGLENYNLEANVKTASYILQEQLKKYDILSIIEERSPTEQAKKDGLSYPYSYRYSKSYALENIKKHPTLKYFIDLHRDGVNKSVSTVEIDGKKYAKIMFVVGTLYEESKENLKLVKKLEEYIKKEYPDILRNTYVNPNDHYNQDISPNSFLIEMGGNHNTLDEIYNSIEVLAKAIYLLENENE